MGKPRCPNCNKYNTEEVVPRTYSKPGSLICFNCRQEYWTPPKNNNHKHSEARQEKVEKRIIHKKRKPWTDHMDNILDEAIKTGDIFDLLEGKSIIIGPEFNQRSREAGA